MKSTLLALFVTLAASTAQAAIINIADYSLTPDGTNVATTFQNTNVNTLNGGPVLPGSGTPVVYYVTTYTFGANSNAHLQTQFFANEASAPRLGIEVNDDGLVTILGSGNTNVSPTFFQTNFNLGQDLAGQTVTLLAKLSYDANNSVTNSQTNASNDTIMNVWVNPTSASVEGSGLYAGDLHTIWNSAGFNWFRQNIQNQNTPGTAGDSSITNTVILTGSDATFANALAVATIPEPSSVALLGLGGLGGLLMLRRRRQG